MKNIFFLIVIVTTFFAFAKEGCCPGCPCNIKGDCAHCSTISKSCPEFSPTPAPCDYGINTPYSINLSCPRDVCVTGSYLYWAAFEDKLTTYTLSEKETNTAVTPNTSQVQYSQGQVGCDYNSGFKVGIGWGGEPDSWVLSATYLWYHHSFSENFSLPVEIVPTSDSPKIFPTFSLISSFYSESITAPSNLSSTWTLNLDLIDFDLERKYYVGNCLLFKTSCGLRNTYLSQKMQQKPHLQFSMETATVSLQGAVLNNNLKQKISSWGLGPKVGLDCAWQLGRQPCGFSIIGKTSASLLYTSYTLEASESSTVVSDTSTQLTEASLETLSPCAVRPYLDLGLGLNWGTYLNCDSWYLDLYVGYDFMALWSQNMFPSIRTFPSNHTDKDAIFDILGEDLFLHGLTVSALFKF